jgi:predicted GIY-YIG superfamily endonuclease
LLSAHEQGLRPCVICLESRPMLEGQRFAALLAENGLPVTLAVDAAAYDCAVQADVLFLGVDSLTPEGVLGKVGIAGLSLAARKFGLPVYALADRAKIWPAGLGAPVIRQRPVGEVWAGAPLGVSVSNRYFDVAEWATVTGVVAGDGVLTGAQVRRAGRAIHVHAGLAALYREVAEGLPGDLPEQRDWYLYIISCSDNTLYTGITTDLQRRLAQHNAGQGAAYTAARRPVALRAAWLFPNRSAATRAERAMKRRSRPDKLKAIARGEPFDGGPPAPIEPFF